MATLKNLVDEIAVVEEKIVECRDSLKQILIDKKIDDLEKENKLSTLISKIGMLRHYVKDEYFYYKNNTYNSITGGYYLSYRQQWSPSSITYNSEYMNIATPNSFYSYTTISSRSAVTVNTVDYRYINFKIYAGENSRGSGMMVLVGLSTKPDVLESSSEIVVKYSTYSDINTTIKIPISSLNSGSYYPFIHVAYNTICNIYSIYLSEK